MRRLFNESGFENEASPVPGALMGHTRANRRCQYCTIQPGPSVPGRVTTARRMLLSGVYIVCDSSCDLERTETDAFQIEVVPLTIRFGNDEFTDRRDLSVEDFYVRMSTSEDLPQTACPSPGAFGQAFRNASDAGADAVICLTISSGLSNTYESARTAASGWGGPMPVHVIDTKSASSGLGTLVLEAAKTAGGGADVATVVGLVEDLIPRTHVIAALNTLENLKKGGRIGGAKAMVGSILSIKPLLDLTCAKVASMIKGKTPEQIRKTFNITNDFTPEEEEAVRAENKWAEES